MCVIYLLASLYFAHLQFFTLPGDLQVASSAENPFPGKLFNQPTAEGVPGVDVYDGCVPTYRGEIVTAQLFLDVLTGNKTDPTRTKVLESGPEDFVFVNFADHGGGKIVEFPVSGLQRNDLIHAYLNLSPTAERTLHACGTAQRRAAAHAHEEDVQETRLL